MKTGMLEDTRAVAGYVLAASGRRYVVVAIINHPNAGRGTGAHDALIDWVYQGGLTAASPYNSAPCQSHLHVYRSRYSRAFLAPEKPRC